MRIKSLLVLSALVLVIASCAPAAAPTSPVEPTRPATIPPAQSPAVFSRNGTPAPTPALSGEFTFAPGDGSIWIQDTGTGRAHPLVTPSPDLFADAPSFAPDGKHIAYVQSSLKEQGVVESSIHSIDVDSKDNREVIKSPDPKTGFNYPTFSPDGKWIYFSASYPVPPSDRRYEIQRVPVAGGASEKVLQDGRSGVLSPDGKRIAFQRFNNQTFASSLWIADANGQNAQPLLAEDVFASIAAPRFSPDGQWILFVASGPPTRPLPMGMSLPRHDCEPQLLCLFAAPAHANGLPWDLWLVSVDGARFRQLTDVGADSPWPAWSRDSRYIAFFETTGIYVLDVNSRVLAKLNGNGGHGVFDWWAER